MNQGNVKMYLNGKSYDIPSDKVQEAKNDGLSFESRQNQQSQQNGNRTGLESALHSAANFVDPFNKGVRKVLDKSGINSIISGGMEGLANPAISAINLPLEAMTGKKIPHTNFTQYAPQDTGNRLLQSGAKLAGELLPVTKGFNAAQQGLKYATKSPLAQSLGAGALTGYATNEEGPGGRAGGAALGTAGGVLGNYLPKLSYKNIEKDITKGEDLARALAKEKYGNFFNKAGNEIITPEKNYNVDKILNNLTPKQSETFEKYLTNPTMENAHWAQSDLNKVASKLKNGNYKQMPLSEQKSLYKDILNARSGLKNEIEKSLSKNGDYSLSNEYKKLGKDYLKNVAPYNANALTKYKEGDMYGKELIKALQKSKKFSESEVGKQYNAYQARKTIDSILNNKWVSGGLMGAGSVGAGAGVYNLTK